MSNKKDLFEGSDGMRQMLNLVEGTMASNPYIVMLGTPEEDTLVFVFDSSKTAGNFGDIVNEVELGYGSWEGYLSKLPKETQDQIMDQNPVPHTQPINVDDFPDEVEDDDLLRAINDESKIYVRGGLPPESYLN